MTWKNIPRVICEVDVRLVVEFHFLVRVPSDTEMLFAVNLEAFIRPKICSQTGSRRPQGEINPFFVFASPLRHDSRRLSYHLINICWLYVEQQSG